MWKKFGIYSILKVLVRKGRAFYATFYQEVFFGNPGGGVLNIRVEKRFKGHSTLLEFSHFNESLMYGF